MNIKARLKVGDVEFEGEGSEAWIEKQFAKILEYTKTSPRQVGIPLKGQEQGIGSGSGKVPNLANYLKSKNATSKQVLKFLATANWLHISGNQRLKTSDVSKALNTSNQGSLVNPSDALRQNIAKGHCERDGANFFVTSEGRLELGENE